MVRASPGSYFCSRKHIFNCGEGENEATGSLAWAQNTTYCCSTKWWRWGVEEEGHMHQPASPGWAACRTAKGRLSLKESWVSRHQRRGSVSLFSRLIWNTNLRFFCRRTSTLARTWLAAASESCEELWVFVRPCLRIGRAGWSIQMLLSCSAGWRRTTHLQTVGSPARTRVLYPWGASRSCTGRCPAFCWTSSRSRCFCWSSHSWTPRTASFLCPSSNHCWKNWWIPSQTCPALETKGSDFL